jgi:hypothetical protein
VGVQSFGYRRLQAILRLALGGVESRIDVQVVVRVLAGSVFGREVCRRIGIPTHVVLQGLLAETVCRRDRHGRECRLVTGNGRALAREVLHHIFFESLVHGNASSD